MPSEHHWGPLCVRGFYFFIFYPYDNPKSWNFYPHFIYRETEDHRVQDKLPKDAQLISERSEIWTHFSVWKP